MLTEPLAGELPGIPFVLCVGYYSVYILGNGTSHPAEPPYFIKPIFE